MTALLAGLMALNAFAIDAMVPALPAIGRSLGVAHENDRQLVIVAYFVGFASTQLLWGPLADRFGRKPVLAAGIILYTLFALLCASAASFPLLISGRVAMGASAAVTRVLVIAMVRDLFEGEAMARVMSLVFMVFMLVPVLAPNVGQAILLVASWRAIFFVLAGYALTMLIWSSVRLPETLHPEFRRRSPRATCSAPSSKPCANPSRAATRWRRRSSSRRWSPISRRSSRSCSTHSTRAASSGWCSPRSPRRWQSRRGPIRGWWDDSGCAASDIRPPPRSPW